MEPVETGRALKNKAPVQYSLVMACFVLSAFGSLMLLASKTSAQHTMSPPYSAVKTELAAFNDWVVQCVDTENTTPDHCTLYYYISLDNGYPLLVFQINRTTLQQAGEQYIGIFNVPLGVYLPSGIAVEIDQSVAWHLTFERCDQNGCYAGDLMGNHVISALQQGNEAVVQFTDVAGQLISARISLIGFTDGLGKL